MSANAGARLAFEIALGASARRARTSAVSQTLKRAAIGLLRGPTRGARRRTAARPLFGVGAADPTSYVSALPILGGVVLVAGYVPATRASRVDPGVTLRDG